MKSKQSRSQSNELECVIERIGMRFARSEARQRAADYLRGLLGRMERKNGKQLADFAGEATPCNVQYFLGRSTWNADEVGEDLRRYVADNLGGEDGVLIVDETSFRKNGKKSIGVERQYSGTDGQIENCQIGVFIAYHSRHGHALVDRAIYVSQNWFDDRRRCRAAAIPEEVRFATKPELARILLARTLASNLSIRWITADAVYGGDDRFRRFLEERPLDYVLAVPNSQTLAPSTDHRTIEEHAASIPKRDWRRMAAESDDKKERSYGWAYHSLAQGAAGGWTKGLLVRRVVGDPTPPAYRLTHAPTSTDPRRLVEVAESRRAAEECFVQAKEECGLDEYEVRTLHAWQRHITLSMFALAVLAALRSRLLDRTPTRQ